MTRSPLSLHTHRPAALAAALSLLAALASSCTEPTAGGVAGARSDEAIVEQFLQNPNDASAIAAAKPIFASQRGQELLRQLTPVRRAASAGLGTPTRLVGDPTYTATAIPFAPDPKPAGQHWALEYDDATTGLLPLGFNFTFFGNTYSAVNISTNGFLGFDTYMSQGCCSGQTIPRADFLNNIVAGLWTDLHPFNGAHQVTYGVYGIAPFRRFVVDWADVHYYPNWYGTSTVSFQIKLFEGSNDIEIHTKQVSDNYHARTQGIENAAGTDAAFIPGRVASLFVVSTDAVRFHAGPVDNTPPVITPMVSGTEGDNGWYTTDVSVTWNVEDAESDVTSTTGCEAVSITSDQAATVYTCSATSLGGSATASVTIQRDATAPEVAYAGNAATYTVDQSIDITCSAADAMSGLATSTCADVSGDAYSFALGNHMFAASATDNAGNTGAASITFGVEVTPASLCVLVRRWVEQPGVANSLCQKLDAASSGAPMNNRVRAFTNELRAQSGKHVPADKARILADLAAGLLE